MIAAILSNASKVSISDSAKQNKNEQPFLLFSTAARPVSLSENDLAAKFDPNFRKPRPFRLKILGQKLSAKRERKIELKKSSRNSDF